MLRKSIRIVELESVDVYNLSALKIFSMAFYNFYAA